MSDREVELSEKYPVPRIVYQYLPPPEGGRDTTNILSARRFKLSKIGTMNDPFDMLPVFKEVRDPSIIRNYLERSATRFDMYEKITPAMVAAWKARWEVIYDNPIAEWSRVATGTRVLCLSSRNNGVLLWSHYGQNHRGFAVGFRSDVLIETKPATLLFEVEYDDERPEFDITTVHDEQCSAESLLPLFKRKSREWSYEREWRATHRPETLNDGEYLPFSVEAVECVILGALIEKDVILRLNQACKTSGLDSVPLKKARLAKKRFELEILPTTWSEVLKREQGTD